MPDTMLRSYIERSSQADDLKTLSDLFREFLLSLDVEHCLVIFSRIFRTQLYISPFYEHLPNDAFTVEDHYDLFVATNLGQRSLTAHESFSWNRSALDPNQTCDQRARTYMINQGLAGGFCVPIVHSFSSRSTALFMFRRMEQIRGRAFALQTAALYLLNDIMRINSKASGFVPCGERSKTAALSSREAEIISWIAMGKSSWETATILSISEHTVNGHVENAVRKLGATNRTEAVAIALLTHQVNLLERGTQQFVPRPSDMGAG